MADLSKELNKELSKQISKDFADCEDTISRQAAIDVADAVWSVTGDKNVAKVWDQIKDLPSVQPERTCVNCGRTVNNGGWYADGGTRCPIEEHYALPKDGYCHLWENRKEGAKDD